MIKKYLKREICKYTLSLFVCVCVCVSMSAYVWVSICPSPLLLAALNEQCQVSTVQHWGFFKVSLAQSAMNYWAWASSLPVCATSDCPPSFKFVTLTNQITNHGSVRSYWSLQVNLLLFTLLKQEVRQLTYQRGPKERTQRHFQFASSALTIDSHIVISLNIFGAFMFAGGPSSCNIHTIIYTHTSSRYSP